MKVGMVSVDGTKIDANASKIKSLRYDRIEVLRARLEADIAELMAQAQAADQGLTFPMAACLCLPDWPVRLRAVKTLKTKLDAAAKRS